MLEIKDLTVAYGSIVALRSVSMIVEDGKIFAVLGANGAGKSSLLRCVSGLIPVVSGEVFWCGKPLTAKAADEIVGMGICHVPEGRWIFPKLTVKENLLMGAYLRRGSLEKEFDYVFSLFGRLKNRLNQAGGTLSGGEQQMLAIGRALMGKPKVLILDEPSLGIAPILVQEIFNTIVEINQNGVTVLLVEQNSRMALKVAHDALVLESGAVTLTGKAKDLAENKDVQRAYFGAF